MKGWVKEMATKLLRISMKILMVILCITLGNVPMAAMQSIDEKAEYEIKKEGPDTKMKRVFLKNQEAFEKVAAVFMENTEMERMAINSFGSGQMEIEYITKQFEGNIKKDLDLYGHLEPFREILQPFPIKLQDGLKICYVSFRTEYKGDILEIGLEDEKGIFLYYFAKNIWSFYPLI